MTKRRASRPPSPRPPSTPRLSVAIPVYNEEDGLAALFQRVGGMLDQTPGGPHELVLVDDGSSDRTADILAAEVARDPRLVVITLSRNFGHQAALTAALDHVTGDVVVVMDGDLQDPPEIIPALLERYAAGYDVVYAQREKRKEAWYKRAAYHAFYRLFDALAGFPIPLDAGDFGLLSRPVVDEMRRTREQHRFLRGLRAWVGFSQTAIPVERAARHAGDSKYTLKKLLQLAFDGMFAFSTVPIRASALVGAVGMMLAMAYGLYALFVKLVYGTGPQGFTALTGLILFTAALNLFFLGVIGEYVGRVYAEVKARPIYITRAICRGSTA